MNESTVPGNASEDRFDEVLELINSARQQSMRAVNTCLIELYWQVGAYMRISVESRSKLNGAMR